MAIKKTVAKLKSLYTKFNVETRKNNKKEVEAIEKQFPLPTVLKEYYLKIGNVDFSDAMYEMYDIGCLRMFTKEDYQNLKSEYKGDYLIFATEIAGVCEYAIKREDLTLENPPLYYNYNEGAADNSFWIPASLSNTDEECFDTVLDFMYEIAKSMGVDPEPRNNPKNIQLVIDVLQGNRPEDDITVEVIKDVTKLEGLKKTELKNFKAISKLVNIFELSIWACEGIDVSSVASLTKITSLSIVNCCITNIAGIEQLKKLKYLNLSGNNIHDMFPIINLTKLEALYVSSCYLNDISFITYMHNLFVLDASDNQITAFPAFDGEYKLATLTLSNNKISSLENIQALKSLDRLIMQNNPLVDISALKDLSKLSIIDFNNCQLQDISVITQIKGFHTLAAKNNQIKNLPQLTKLNKFGTLELENNKIETITPLVEAGYIYYLQLDGNPLNDISAIKNITGLQSVTLDKNIDVPETDYYYVENYSDNKVINIIEK